MNRLVKTTKNGKATGYFYDNAGNRFIKVTDETTSFYLRHGQIAVAMDMELANSDTTTDVGKINRYVLSGDLLAGRITTKYTKNLTTQGVTATVDKYWYHLDHLNSTKAVTKVDGTLDVLYEYRAFGEELKRIGEGDAKYTYGGKELDASTNLYYFNARYYDAAIGRFINVDPIQDGTNWYVYCSNNPLAFVDPTGLSDKDTLQDATIEITKCSETKDVALLHGFPNEQGISNGKSVLRGNSSYRENKIQNGDLVWVLQTDPGIKIKEYEVGVLYLAEGASATVRFTSSIVGEPPREITLEGYEGGTCYNLTLLLQVTNIRRLDMYGKSLKNKVDKEQYWNSLKDEIALGGGIVANVGLTFLTQGWSLVPSLIVGAGSSSALSTAGYVFNNGKETEKTDEYYRLLEYRRVWDEQKALANGQAGDAIRQASDIFLK